jgi:hypothetical protein
VNIDEAKGRSEIVEKNRNRRGIERSRERSVEYSTVGCMVTITFIMFGMWKREVI